MSFTKAFLLFLSFVASVYALTTAHPPYSRHHRGLAARLPSSDPPVALVRKRQNSKRCRPRSSAASESRPPQTSGVLAHVSQSAPEPATTHEASPATTHKPSPSPSTTKEAETPTTTKHSSPAPISNLPSFLIGTQHGQGTFYGTGLGACGITNKDSDHIAAVSHSLFDVFPEYSGVNPNTNPVCGRKVTATYQGKSVTVTITDRCAACLVGDLDLSPSAFQQIADPSLGRIDISWKWD